MFDVNVMYSVNVNIFDFVNVLDEVKVIMSANVSVAGMYSEMIVSLETFNPKTELLGMK